MHSLYKSKIVFEKIVSLFKNNTASFVHEIRNMPRKIVIIEN